jgi:hypothetical protein
MSARRAAGATLLALGLGLAGCPEPGPGPGPDPVGEPLRFEVGTGLRFTPIEEGARLALESGGQGSQHVSVSMRVWDLSEMRARVELSLERTSDGARVSAPYAVDLRFSQYLPPGEPSRLEGLLLVVPDPSEAVDREVRLKASFVAESGEHGSDTRTVILKWRGAP